MKPVRLLRKVFWRREGIGVFIGFLVAYGLAVLLDLSACDSNRTANFMIEKAARYLTKQEKTLIFIVLLILLSGAGARRFFLEKPQSTDGTATKEAADASGRF